MRFKYVVPSLLAPVTLICAAVLSGCASDAVFPNSAAVTSTSPATAAVSSIQGSNYGGHAPIVGGHVFVLEANPNATGYGQLVKSLLGSTSANASYPTAQDTTQGSPTNGMYYITTDTQGQFFITGDYTCDIGYPVYLYAPGGNPQAGTPTTFPSSISVTGATGNDVTLNSTSGSTTSGTLTNDYVVTFTTTGNQTLYQGEQIKFAASGIPAGSYSGFNGGTYTVSPYNLTTTTFSIDLGTGSGNSVPSQAQQPFNTTVTQASSLSNPAIANMALLGVCGDTSPTNPTAAGTTNFTNLNFVFMNEVSTAATAYAMAGFFQTPSYTFTVTIGNTPHNGVPVTAGVQNLLGNLTATGSGTGTVKITGAVVSPTSGGNYTVTMTASGAVTSTDQLTFSSPDNNGSFGNFISGALLSVTSSYTTTDAVHISVPASDTMALTGLQNAARNAALLYDIQGGNVGTNTSGTSCTTNPTNPPCDGDSHIARATTPNGGNGTVPQALINTVGNILANCVDSSNLYGVTNPTGTESYQCSSLFSGARNDGTTTGLTPYDTATAAINIAHFPGGATTNTTYASTLFNSVTGNVPFAPNLSMAPHDYAVGIKYQTPATLIDDIAIDASGDVWTVGNSSNEVVELTPKGTFSLYTPPSGTTIGNPTPNQGYTTGITIDTNGTVFASAAVGTVKFTPGTPVGTVFGTANSANGGQMAVDSSDNLYIANWAVGNADANLNYYTLLGNNPLANSDLVKESAAGTAAGGNFPIGPGNQLAAVANGTQNTAAGCIPAVSYLALDASNNIWTSNVNNTFSPYAAVCRFDSAGNFKYSFSITDNSTALPHQIAVDNGNNAWFGEKNQNFVYKIAAGSTTAGSGTTLATGGSLAGPKGVAIDGANTVWVSNTGYSTGNLVHYTNAAAAISPTYYGGTGYGGNSYLYLSVDQSGNVWAVDNSDGILVQYIGIGTPTAQPFSKARATTGLGARP
jgi:hypothetical protein